MCRFVRASSLLCVLLAARAQAETVQWVSAPRIAFRDAVPQALGTLGTLDLGAAPPPGSSRLFSRDELRTLALRAHERVDDLEIPADVRVMRATRRFSARELEVLIRPALVAKLPEGAAVKNLGLPSSYVSVPDVQVGAIQLPRLPKRAGMTRVTVVFELTSTGALVARLPVSVELQLDERMTRYSLERGSMLNLVIDTGTTRVSASAVLMNPADIGDIVACQIIKTRKVLRAKVLTTREATVVQQ
jgi:hypothetical protein